jgi:pimeloyl-ACP methyl ester carboxylesterase
VTYAAHRVALATGITYNVLEWDHPGETTFVLVHGFLDLAYGWHGIAPLLDAHVIAPDLRGHGDSDWIGGGGYYHYMDYVADLDDVIARFARKRLVVVGHSMGGGVASYWCGTRPDRVHALALLEGLGPPDQSEVELAPRTAQWIEGWKSARGRQRAMTSLADAGARLRKHDPLLSVALSEKLAEHGTRPAPSGDGIVWKHDPLHLTMGPYPFRTDHAARFWRRITCPALVVDGAQSFMNLPDAERAARRAQLPNHEHVVLEGAGHMMQRHQPAALAHLLKKLAQDPHRGG